RRQNLPTGCDCCRVKDHGSAHNALSSHNNQFGAWLASQAHDGPGRGVRRALGDQVMGIFGALNTAVTGMRAQSFALENVSGNIANSQTTAFKRMDTSFVDLIPDQVPTQQLAGSVAANSRATNSVQGDIQANSIGTFMAI